MTLKGELNVKALQNLKTIGSSSSNNADSAAILIDWENVNRITSKSLKDILSEIRHEASISIMRAYADWSLHQNGKLILADQGCELVQMPGNTFKKNSADLKLAVDAVEILYTCPQIRTLVLLSGDRDFLPLVHLAKRLGRKVWCFGPNGSTSELLKRVCDRWSLIPNMPQPPRNCVAGSDLPAVTPELKMSVALAFQRAWEINATTFKVFGQVPIGISRFFSCLRAVDQSFEPSEFCGKPKRVHALSAKRLADAGSIKIDDKNQTSLYISPTKETLELIEGLSLSKLKPLPIGFLSERFIQPSPPSKPR